MTPLPPAIDWIKTQDAAMREHLVAWSNINSGTGNVQGIRSLIAEIRKYAADLGGQVEEHALPPVMKIDARGQSLAMEVGPLLRIVKRPESSVRVLLNIHLDTVYPPGDSFQTASHLPDGNLRGPGVADAKGGLLVLLTALAAFERTEFAAKIGWEVILNPDEEIGSPSSVEFLSSAARRNHFGLLFEPSPPDGALVDRRKGSGHFSILIRGRRAHTGRDFEKGRSAIFAAAQLTLALHELNRTVPGIIANVGAIDGGGPANVVPDLAIVRVNLRTADPEHESILRDRILKLTNDLNERDGIRAELHGKFTSPPKILDARGLALLQAAIDCGRDLGLNLSTRPTGGSCDGNKLAAAGLANIDTLGVRGGNLHSPEEYMIPQSLVERSQLTTLLLIKIATDEQMQKKFSHG